MSDLVSYTSKDLITTTTDLTEYQKDLIAYSLSRDWAMPEFKAKHFVGQAQITPYAIIKQYLLELNSREGAIENLEYETRKLQCQIAIEIEKRDDAETLGTKSLHEVEIMHLERLLKKNLHKIKDAYTERQIFIKLLDDINNSDEGKLPSGELIMDAIRDPAKEEQLEKEYWTLRLAKQTALDMIAYGRAGVGNMEAVGMLPEEQQIEVMTLACDYYVRNEYRTQTLLSSVNENFQLGIAPEKLTQHLKFNPQEN
jgi:hypothetical protein